MTARTASPGDTDAAVEFLDRFTTATGAHTVCLVAIIPDGPTETATFAAGEAASQHRWIGARQNRKNLYFTVNGVKGTPADKPDKNTMATAVAVWADIDPRDGADLSSERKRIQGEVFRLQCSAYEPSFVIDSGGGFQFFWLLQSPVALDGPDGKHTLAVEAIGRRLALRFGADHCQNVDRLMRLPGTINLPGKVKRAKGRPRALAALVDFSSRRYTPEQLRDLSVWNHPDLVALDGALRAKVQAVLAKDASLFARWHGDDTGLKKNTRSEFDMSISASLKGWRFAADEVGSVLRLAFKHGVGADLDDRQIDRMFERSEMTEGGKVDKTPQRDQLLEIGLTAELWHDGRGEPFASVKRGGHAEHYPVDSGAFKNWLINEFMSAQQKPAAPTMTAVSEALAAIKAKASGGATRETFVRVGECEGRIYVDLGSDKWDAIEVDAAGWRVVSAPPVPMLRYAGMEPLPYPTRGGSIEELRKFVNPPDTDAFKLIVGYCVAALFPRGPHMLLEFAGQMGSLKSTATRVIKRTIDPNTVSLRSKPKSEDDLFISAERNHILAFENFSSINEELSDQLCRLATGAGIAKRSLFTNKDETLLNACKPVIVNGIPDLINRDDLADRAIMIVLPPFTGRRRADEEVTAEIDNVSRPIILGALLDGVSCAIEHYRTVELPEDGPRMADFAKRVIAAFPAFGWPAEDFMRIWREYRSNVAENAVQGDGVARAVRKFIAEHGTWQGEPEELLSALEWTGSRDKYWPTTGAHLCNRLRRAAPMLRSAGIAVDLDRKHPKTRRRVIAISKAAV